MDPPDPTRPARQGIFVSLGQIARAVLGQRLDQKRRLTPVFAGFQLVRPASATVGDDQFVDGIAFGPGNLHENTRTVEDGGPDRLSDQIVEVMQGLRGHT